MQFSTLITLAMLTEVVFFLVPDIGQWLIDGIYQRNFIAHPSWSTGYFNFSYCGQYQY
ncbi:MAG: hypothetical protein U5L01_04540 [Rheinheimera sp.]|nr:hypothetical protein [Rheinheimera sp.]